MAQQEQDLQQRERLKVLKRATTATRDPRLKKKSRNPIQKK
eukprot:CAMPEP_0180137828 /NCGR_PEP_ID=MMETSP0986-20121125/12479_1 /TAXON_ID=697907 /ORGANISM="non described non described, Strain CCMP2293" /LENGTH=40 /DNA_ID= /DNA_START= /DNA_END= /DNA_ORIENTATION=